MGQSNAAPVFHSYAAQHVERWPLPLEQGQEPLTMPTSSIYSRLDGVAAWQACLDVTSDRSENIEVFASHLGIGNHAAVLWAIADRLAQPEGDWQPFEPPTWFAWAYPTPAEPCP